jgi:hypothetical protein
MASQSSPPATLSAAPSTTKFTAYRIEVEETAPWQP